jgi:hypothetical protein
LNERRNRVCEALATLQGAIFLLFCIGSPFIFLGVISLDRLLAEGPFEPFRVGGVAIPKFLAPGVNNLSVLILAVVGFVALLDSVAHRYFYHRKNLEYLRSKGINDFNGDGRRDTFADEFLDDL